MGAVQTMCCGSFKNYIQKNIKGVLIMNIHKVHQAGSIPQLKEEKLLKNIIKQSLVRLQEKSNIFIEPSQSAKRQQNLVVEQKTAREGGLCGTKYKISSRNNTISPQNIEFSAFKINAQQWPYIIGFDLNIDMLEGEHIFCENIEKQNFEIFDGCEDKGEVSFISCFWFSGEKNFKPVQQGDEQFITDNDEAQPQFQFNQTNSNINNQNNKQYQQQMQYEIPEQENEDLPPSLEIKDDYYTKYFRKILLFEESEKSSFSLYYDILKEKLFTVKQFKNQFDHIDATHVLIQNEKQRVLRAIRDVHLPENERFMEKYDDGIKGLKRNIVREIMISYICKQLINDGINALEGVIVGEKDFKIVYEYFGGTEIHSQTLNCDLESYFKYNLPTYFQHKNLQQTQEIIQDVMFNTMSVVESLHQQGIFMRDIQPKNILVRRRFNPTKPQESLHEVQLINFGKSKRIPLENDLTQSSLAQYYNRSKTQLNNQQSQKILSKPQQLFGKDNNENKNFLDFQRDDTFQLGILMYKIHLILGLSETIDESTKQNLERMTGLPFHLMTEFQDIMQKVKELFKGGLEEALKYEEKIEPIFEVKQKWNKKFNQEEEEENYNNNNSKNDMQYEIIENKDKNSNQNQEE